MNEHELAEYIVEWLRHRNRGEMDDAFRDMRVGDFESLHGELAHILKHKGHPPNWVPREEKKT